MARLPTARAAAGLLWPAVAGLVATAVLRLSGRTVRGSSSVVAFTPTATLGGWVLTALALVLGARRAAAIAGMASAALTVVVAPRARSREQPTVAAGSPDRLRVMSANCLLGRADAAALVALVREHRPDVLALQEQGPPFVGRLEQAGLFELLPHRVLGPGGRLADAGLVSLHPLSPLDRGDLPSECATALATLPGGRTVPLLSFHPLPPVGRRPTRRWQYGLEALPAPTGAFAGGVIAGDFNATLDHPELRAVLARGWRDAGAERGGGLRATWSRVRLLRLTIDHVLVPPGAAVADYRVDRLRGSDHRVITVTLLLPPPEGRG